MPEITIYSRMTCAPCHMVKKWLAHKNIPYTEKSVDDPVFAQEAYGLSGVFTVPVIKIGESVITGPNFGRLAQLLTTKH